MRCHSKWLILVSAKLVLFSFNKNVRFFVELFEINDFFIPASKSPEGNLEAKLRCAYRRNDVSQSLLSSFQKRNSFYFNCLQSTQPSASDHSISSLDTVSTFEDQSLEQQQPPLPPLTQTKDYHQHFTAVQLHQLKHRELFYSKFTEPSVSVKLFRGKVSLHFFMPDVHSFSDFLSSTQPDKFFYQISYDPNLKLISDDRTQIRVGARYQAEVPALLLNDNRARSNDESVREELLWKESERFSSAKTALNSYFKKIVDKKIRRNQQYSLSHSNCEMNESRDSIMVIYLKINLGWNKAFFYLGVSERGCQKLNFVH